VLKLSPYHYDRHRAFIEKILSRHRMMTTQLITRWKAGDR
jgi:hypothetical protein